MKISFFRYTFTNWIALGIILDQTSQCSLVWISLVPTPKLEHPNNKSIGFQFFLKNHNSQNLDSIHPTSKSLTNSKHNIKINMKNKCAQIHSSSLKIFLKIKTSSLQKTFVKKIKISICKKNNRHKSFLMIFS